MENIEAHSMKLLGTVPASSMRSNAVHFYPDDVLYGRLRPYLNKVYRADFEGLCSAEFIVFPAQEWLRPKFLQYFLNSSAFVSFASHLNAGDRPRVDFDQIGEYPTPLPPLKEQDRIIAEIEKQFTRLDAAVAALKRVQANLKRYRASVLKAACEGRLVPTEAELARREARSYEHASTLLKRVSARHEEKTPDLVTDSDEQFGNAPGGWVETNLASIIEDNVIGIDRGRARQSEVAPGSPYIKMNNVNLDGRVSYEPLFYVQVSVGESAKFAIKDGDILFNTRNSIELVGKTGLVKSPPARAVFNNNLMRIRLFPPISSAFVCAQMCSDAHSARDSKRSNAQQPTLPPSTQRTCCLLGST